MKKHSGAILISSITGDKLVIVSGGGNNEK